MTDPSPRAASLPTPALPVVASLEGLPVSAAVAARLLDYARAADGALAANTVRALRSDLALWTAWCAARQLPPVPASPGAIADFVLEQAVAKAMATVRRYVASLATLHRAADVNPLPTRAEAVRLALRAAGRAKAAAGQGTRQRQVPGLTQRDVDRMVAACGTATIDLRDVALLLTARDLLARRSELAALRVEDLRRVEDGSGRAVIRRSKTDPEGQGAVGYLAPEAVRAVDAWLARAGHQAGPLFRGVHKTGAVGQAPLEPGDVARVFKKLARRAALPDADLVAGHSARVGMAQDLIAAGAELPAVMQAGRWKSPAMPARYGEHLLAGDNAVAQFHRQRRSARRR